MILPLLRKPLIWLFVKMAFRFVKFEVVKDDRQFLLPEERWNLVLRNSVVFSDWHDCVLRAIYVTLNKKQIFCATFDSHKINYCDSFDLPYGASIDFRLATQKQNTNVLLPCKVKNRIEFPTEYKMLWKCDTGYDYVNLNEKDQVEIAYELIIGKPTVRKRFAVAGFVSNGQLTLKYSRGLRLDGNLHYDLLRFRSSKSL